jgi:hypothetical protein
MSSLNWKAVEPAVSLREFQRDGDIVPPFAFRLDSCAEVFVVGDYVMPDGHIRTGGCGCCAAYASDRYSESRVTHVAKIEGP